MIKKILITLLTFGSSLLVNLSALASGMDDDPVITKIMIDQFEVRVTEGADPVVLEAQAWIGQDLRKIWLKTDLERVEGDTEEAEFQALYSQSISPFWELQVGWRHDARPAPNRDWVVIGFQGLSPYWFEVDTAIFIGESGRIGARLEAEYEVMFTQRLILTPEIEANAYSKDDKSTGIGSGFADIGFGLRLRYEIRREFAPYIGVNWERKFGQTANYARDEGEGIDDTQVVVGVRAWF